MHKALLKARKELKLRKPYNAREDWCERQERRLENWDWRVVNMDSERTKQIMRTLSPLRDTCKDCTMCRLGLGKPVGRSGIPVQDQHVFSNMIPSEIMVVGQNPGFDECQNDEPFVGDAGQNFSQEIGKYGVSREDFYITNVVKCSTENNKRAQQDEIDACEPFLRMEVRLLRPKLVLTLGKVAFEAFCPHIAYSEGLGKISTSMKYGVKVFAAYHPSPVNLKNPEIKAAYEKQIALVCALSRKLLKED